MATKKVKKMTKKTAPKTAKKPMKKSTTKMAAKMSPKKSAKKSAKKTTKKSAQKTANMSAKKPMQKIMAKTTKKAPMMMTNKVKVQSVKNAKPISTPTPVSAAGMKNSGLKISMNQVTTLPDLTLPSTGGAQINLKELAGKKVVLYFYPKDMTPGCTIEGHDFTKLKEEFSSHNTVVYGVSRDSVEMHEKFKSKECYTIDLLSDADGKLCNTFGVIKDKNMYGKMVRGIERSTFVIDENGSVVKEWRGVKVEGHAQEVLNFVTTAE